MRLPKPRRRTPGRIEADAFATPEQARAALDAKLVELVENGACVLCGAPPTSVGRWIASPEWSRKLGAPEPGGAVVQYVTCDDHAGPEHRDTIVRRILDSQSPDRN